MLKKVALFILLIFIVIQFFQPNKNQNTEILATDITKITMVPDDVLKVLKTACYDCHSNNTAYPWYNNIQPVAWWLNKHINNGKRRLNFSTFGDYTAEKASKKIHEIEEVIDENEMPLTSYTLIHGNAKLNAKQRELVANWAKNVVINNMKD